MHRGRGYVGIRAVSGMLTWLYIWWIMANCKHKIGVATYGWSSACMECNLYTYINYLYTCTPLLLYSYTIYPKSGTARSQQHKRANIATSYYIGFVYNLHYSFNLLHAIYASRSNNMSLWDLRQIRQLKFPPAKVAARVTGYKYPCNKIKAGYSS